MSCPHCAEPLDEGAAFCEACGQPVSGASPAPSVAPADVSQEAAPFETTTATEPQATVEMPGPRPCLECGGEVGADGYCESCGTKQPSERDHFREQPAPWVAGVCDRGPRKSRNEDAMALAADPRRAVLVVLDGVSNTDRSDEASLAAARAVREALRAPFPSGMGTAQGRAAVVEKAMTDGVVAAQDAILEHTPAGSSAPPSATFSVAVVELTDAGARASVANIGDSRVYWVPDAGTRKQLTVDDSVAAMQMAAGLTRKQAEEGPQGHAITRWLGIDAPDLVPRVVETDLVGPGWLLNCSDGLWNYASEPDDLAAQVAAAATDEPLVLALALTAYATAAGGHDNITVAAARVVGGPEPLGQNASDPQEATHG